MRNCDNCTLCCKLPEINEIGYEKKCFNWCSKIDLEKSQCAIYDNRPLTCKTFSCFYLENKTDLKPSNVGFFIIGLVCLLCFPYPKFKIKGT